MDDAGPAQGSGRPSVLRGRDHHHRDEMLAQFPVFRNSTATIFAKCARTHILASFAPGELKPKMTYVEENLIPGETLIYRTGVHWSVLFWPLLLVVIVVAGGIVCYFQNFLGKVETGTFLIAAALVYALYVIIKRNSTEIAVTDRRVIIKTGMASRRSLEVMLAKVESIGIEENVMGRMLGYGTVVIHGTGGTPEPFRKIAHPSEFRQRVQEQIDRASSAAR
jgi:uncharacterized membrane protein